MQIPSLVTHAAGHWTGHGNARRPEHNEAVRARSEVGLVARVAVGLTAALAISTLLPWHDLCASADEWGGGGCEGVLRTCTAGGRPEILVVIAVLLGLQLPLLFSARRGVAIGLAIATTCVALAAPLAAAPTMLDHLFSVTRTRYGVTVYFLADLGLLVAGVLQIIYAARRARPTGS